MSILHDANLITIENKETSLKNCLATRYIFSCVFDV